VRQENILRKMNQVVQNVQQIHTVHDENITLVHQKISELLHVHHYEVIINIVQNHQLEKRRVI
jgi:hypothetical protein